MNETADHQIRALGVEDGGQALSRVRRRLGPVILGAAIIAAWYLFISALAYEDRKGDRTLSSFSVLVMLLRGLGHLLTGAAEQVLVGPPPPFLIVTLGVAAALALIYPRRYRPRTWQHDIALALVVPSLVATASLVLRGDIGPAALTGLLAGIYLLACGGEKAGREPSPLLFLIPLGLGALLRFYALAEVPNGYAEHAVAQNVDFSIPYFEALSLSLHAQRLQPFFETASNALIREHSGFHSLIEAIGFELFGVTLTVTRLVSAALGTLTIYVAYRLGRALDRIRLGLVFSFLLAVSPWHVTISRYGTPEHVLSPLQYLLSLLFLVLAVNGGRVRDIFLAALFTAVAWSVYPANLVVPVISGLFLLCRAAMDPRLSIRSWRKVLLGIVCFTLLSYALAGQTFSQGIFQPNVRTGYQASGPILSNLPKRLELIGLEADQLFRRAEDAWFSMPGGGLGVVQSALLVPGLVLVVGALRQRRHPDLALIVLIGLPIAALPAVFAPDPSFRRLMLVTTLVALVAAFTLVRLAEVARGAAIPGKVVIVIACAAAVALGAVGTFGYFDRVFVFEESSHAPDRALGTTVSGLLGKEPLVIVVPRRDNLNDTHRYIKLMAYDMLLDAQHRGVTREALYRITTCEDPVETGGPQAVDASQPVLVVHDGVLDPRSPCGPEFVSRLIAHYPGSPVVIARPPPPPADLVPAQP